MKNQELYNRTIDILVKAYLQGTLEHHNACGCAVGNMIAANCGIELQLTGKRINSTLVSWQGEIDAQWILAIQPDGLSQRELEMYPFIESHIKATGYSPSEIYQIEKAFESFHCDNDEDGYNGLMAVVEALDIIHENTDKDLTQTVKAKFQKV